MSAIAIFQFETTEIRTIQNEAGEPWFVLKDILDGLGSSTRPADAKTSIINALGDGVVADYPIVDALGRPQETTIVSEAGVTYLVARSNTEQGQSLNRFLHLKVLPQIRKTGSYHHMPETYLEALKRLVAEVEAKEIAEAKALALTQQLEADAPYTELARSITGSTTMTRRDWLGLMKTDHNTTLKERALTDWLIQKGYCYRDARDNLLRAMAKYDHYFKLEYETINGYPRPLLKVTGQGVLELTPIVIRELRGE